jgi:thiamine-phosphate pyrophosphorylase
MDYALYLVTDAGLSRGRSQSEIVQAAIRGGVTIVQYREKHAATREMIAEAAELCEICRRNHVPFIVNDRLDVALAVDADGMHVGQDDMPASIARRLIGPDKILGVSAENVEQARAAVADGANYIGASPIFSTPTKPDAPPPMGIAGLEQLTRAVPIPVVAIGGVNANNAAGIMHAHAAGIAVVSAIVSAEDVEASARELRSIVDRFRI